VQYAWLTASCSEQRTCAYSRVLIYASVSTVQGNFTLSLTDTYTIAQQMEASLDLGLGLGGASFASFQNESLMTTFPSADLEFEKFLEAFNPEEFMTDPVSVLDFNNMPGANGSGTEPSSSGELDHGHSDSNAASPHTQSGVSGDAASLAQPASLLQQSFFTAPPLAAEQRQPAPTATMPNAAMPIMTSSTFNTNFMSFIGQTQLAGLVNPQVTTANLPFAFLGAQQQLSAPAAEPAPPAQQRQAAKAKPKRFRERQKEEIATLEAEVERKLKQLQVGTQHVKT
jgi:hypothetical protein